MSKARFRGTSEHTLDEKGRLSLPSRFKEQLRFYESDILMVSVWGKTHLRIYPLAAWEELEDKLLACRDDQTDFGKLVRYLLANVNECPLDKQGRILLSQVIRERTNLQKDIVLVGLIDRMEIWNKGSWQEENQEIHENIGKYDHILSKLGIH